MRKLLVILLYVYLHLALIDAEECSDDEPREKSTRYHIAQFEWAEIKVPMTIALWIFVACIAKISMFNLEWLCSILF